MRAVHVSRAVLLSGIVLAVVILLPRVGARTPQVSVDAQAGAARRPATADASVRDVQSWIEERFNASKAVSLTVAVGEHGRLLWSRSWGYADRERRIPATPQTMYSVASVTKPFTATALMTLVERGAIDLDAPIERYLGGLTLRAHAGPAREATVRRVASHTAGLPTYQNFYFGDESRRLPPLADAIQRYAVIVSPPGERFRYSNLGYAILGHAIAQVSGVTYGEYLQRELFVPLGMTRSGVGVTPALASQQAIRYADDGTRLPPYEADTAAGSSVYASAEDLVRFGFLHVKALAPGQRRILSDASLALMPQRVEPGPTGLGWWSADRTGSSGVLFHGGGMDGVAAIIFLVPAKGLVVVGLSSTKIDLPSRAAAEVINRMSGAVIVDTDRPPLPPPRRGEMPASLAGEWRGEVRAHNGTHPFVLSIAASAELSARLGDQPRASVQTVEWVDDELRGSIVADLGLEDARQPYRLRFHLRTRDPNRLEGSISAWSFRSGRAPDILPAFLRLERVASAAPPSSGSAPD